MPQVKVWNDNVHDYKEKFRDNVIKIPAKKFIVMEQGDAEIFKGTFGGFVRDADGNDMPEGFKMIRIEYGEINPTVAKVNDLLCMVCKYEAANQTDLDEHVKGTHAHLITSDPELDREIAAKKTAKKGDGARF